MLSKPRSILLLILVFALIVRLYNLGYPSAYYFDEVYHAMTAKLVARNDPRAFEWTHGETIEPATYVEWLHPPMAKYAQATMILLYGENAVGWRMSSVLFGVGVIAMTALLAQRLFRQRWLSVLAGGLAALDGLLLTQSRIAMNDIHLVFGYLVTLYVYVWYRQTPQYWRLLIVGLAIGLTIGTKWSGVFVLMIVLLFEFSALVWSIYAQHKYAHKRVLALCWICIKQLLIRFVALLVLPLLIYLASYTQMFLQGKDFAYFIELHQQIRAYQFSLDAIHPYQSYPLEWIYDIRPVWYFMEALPNNQRADIFNTGNPIIFWGGLIAAWATAYTIGFMLIRTLRRHSYPVQSSKKLLIKQDLLLSPMKAPPTLAFSLIFLLCSYLMCWVPWLFSPRIMFSYHYAPAVPLLAIMLAYWMVKLWQLDKKAIQILLIIFLASTISFFILWYPHWVGIPISNTFKEAVYLALPIWR